MKILAALDSSSLSNFVVTRVAQLAENTWADVTLLGIEAESILNEDLPFTAEDRTNSEHPLLRSLRKNRKIFLDHFDSANSPYLNTHAETELIEIQSGLWEELEVYKGAVKQLHARLRPGTPAKAVLAEAQQSQCDLIVIGNSAQYHGGDLSRSVKKIILEANTSVLMVAESKTPRRIVACLDHYHVSQSSLEMINQMVTLYGADLEIVGLTNKNSLPSDVDHEMGQILKYYAANKIKALVSLVEENHLETFATQMAHENLVALWMGKRSIINKLFHPRYVDKLLSNAESSLLLLR